MTGRTLAGHVPGRDCASGDQPAAGHRRGEPPCVQPAPSRQARGRGERGAGPLLGRLVSVLDYRTAYRVVGRAVAAAVDRGDTDLTADLVQAVAEQIGGELVPVTADLLAAATDPIRAVAARDASGGASPRRVREHALGVQRRVEAARCWNADRRAGIAQAETATLEAARNLRSS